MRHRRRQSRCRFGASSRKCKRRLPEERRQRAIKDMDRFYTGLNALSARGNPQRQLQDV